jgi:hydrogenase expression/formation protein HypC
MCVAYPVQVLRLPGDGTADVATPHGPVRVSLFALDDDAVAVGDWLLAHSGIALARLEPRDAAERRSLLDQLHGGPS